MQIPVDEWYQAVKVRRSRRIYNNRPLDDEILAALYRVCTRFTPFPGARAVLADTGPDPVFKGAVGNYGQVKFAPAYIAFVGDTREPHMHAQVGYMGQGIVLEATRLGLATCWVGALFRPDVAVAEVGTADHERVLAVTPVGFVPGDHCFEERVMSAFGRHHNRQALPELVTGVPMDAWPAWVGPALEAARMAPSALNRQPWRFKVEEKAITVSVDSPRYTMGVSKQIDCGIAMLQLELGARKAGAAGTWRFLDHPEVARYEVSD